MSPFSIHNIQAVPCESAPGHLGKHLRRTASRTFGIDPSAVVLLPCQLNHLFLLAGTKELVLGRARANGNIQPSLVYQVFWWGLEHQAFPHHLHGEQAPRPTKNLIQIPILRIQTRTKSPPGRQASRVPVFSASPWPAFHPLNPKNCLPRRGKTKIRRRKQLVSSSFYSAS